LWVPVQRVPGCSSCRRATPCAFSTVMCGGFYLLLPFISAVRTVVPGSQAGLFQRRVCYLPRRAAASACSEDRVQRHDRYRGQRRDWRDHHRRGHRDGEQLGPLSRPMATVNAVDAFLPGGRRPSRTAITIILGPAGSTHPASAENCRTSRPRGFSHVWSYGSSRLRRDTGCISASRHELHPAGLSRSTPPQASFVSLAVIAARPGTHSRSLGRPCRSAPSRKRPDLACSSEPT
jgi:hypothetical protein